MSFEGSKFFRITFQLTQLVGRYQVAIKNPLFIQLKWLKPGDNTFTIITDKKPLKAGIDPYNKLIDRNSDDNLKTVEE